MSKFATTHRCSLGALLAALLFAGLVLSLEARRPELWVAVATAAALVLATAISAVVDRWRAHGGTGT